MRVLIVKTSSLGDVIHTLPAVTDATRAIAGIEFDWVVEEGFAEIPSWHASVHRVIPLAWRRWRKQPVNAWRKQEMQDFFRALRRERYDVIIDAQGLVKSAVVARLAHGVCCGLDFASARETAAALCYQRRYKVVFTQHAVLRMRQLFAAVLGYPVPDSAPDYGICQHFPSPSSESRRLLFVHGASWATKTWPAEYWRTLAQYCTAAHWTIALPWGSVEERQRAEYIAAVGGTIEVLPKLSLAALAAEVMTCRAVVAVDTGLGHLAAALHIPTLSLYGPTDPTQIGACGVGPNVHLTPPSSSREMRDLAPDRVWAALQTLL